MAYQPNIPQATDALSQSQIDIQNNFGALSTFLNVNHVDFASSDQGKHKWVTFPVQGSTPSFAAGEVGLYNMALTGVNELFINKQAQAGVQQIPLTASLLSSATPALGNGGWTYFPSGYYQTFGSGTGSGLTTVTLTYPPPNSLSTVILTPFSATTSYSNVEVRLVNIVSRTQFRCFISVNGVAASASFQFLAIGY